MIIRKLMAVVFACTALGACSQTTSGVTEKPTRKVMAKFASIEPLNQALACMKPTLRGRVVALTAWVDSTGKTNSVADAGTGNFMPGVASADFAIKTLEKAGMTVQDLASVGGEANLRELAPQLKPTLAALTASTMPSYYLNGAWVAMDFDQNDSVDLQIAGGGPLLGMQRAAMGSSVKLVQPGTLAVKGSGGMEYATYSRQVGATVGRLFGSTLVTGGASVGRQQPIQLWSGQYAVTLTTAMALADLPDVPHTCSAMVDEIVRDNNVSF